MIGLEKSVMGKFCFWGKNPSVWDLVLHFNIALSSLSHLLLAVGTSLMVPWFLPVMLSLFCPVLLQHACGTQHSGLGGQGHVLCRAPSLCRWWWHLCAATVASGWGHGPESCSKLYSSGGGLCCRQPRELCMGEGAQCTEMAGLGVPMQADFFPSLCPEFW